MLDGRPDGVMVVDASVADIDFAHLFTRERSGLRDRLRRLGRSIAQDGMIWVSWPKKASKVQTDLTEDVVREEALAAGLVDVKVCAVDEVWSGG